MENATYATLTRQTGLMREMQVVANNIANLSTTGYRGQDLIFSEHVAALEGDSLSMAHADARHIMAHQGALTQTRGPLDFAIEGEGYFLVDTPEGEALTRAGHFIRNETGDLVSPNGDLLLDGGGGPVFVPPDATNVTLSPDGTLSADGRPLAVIGLWQPIDPAELNHRDGVQFTAASGYEPAPPARLLQGFLEESNVNPVSQIARMIEVQRAYELGQGFNDREDKRLRDFLRTVGARA